MSVSLRLKDNVYAIAEHMNSEIFSAAANKHSEGRKDFNNVLSVSCNLNIFY